MAQKKIGELLVDAGIISQLQADDAIRAQQTARYKGKRLGEILVESGLVSEADLAKVLADQLQVPFLDLERTVVDQRAIAKLPEAHARKYAVLPFDLERKVLSLAMTDPLNWEAVKDLQFVSGCQIKPYMATRHGVMDAIDKHYHLEDSLLKLVDAFTTGRDVIFSPVEEEGELLEADESKRGIRPPIVKLVNLIFAEGVAKRASDIHIEPFEKSVLVRDRVDGIMQEALELPKWVQGALTARIKIMATLDITEKRIPQDGRIMVRFEKQEYDIRVSTLPTRYGENVVLRLLNRKAGIVPLENLGLTERGLGSLKEMISKPQGILIVTGPTGSGKTSTLYSAIGAIAAGKTTIITLEDPVEYELKGVNQVQVNDKVGLTFALGLRAILRQDPDVILVGETRDEETAAIMMQAAMTGHLVFTTLHTNGAIETIPRLYHLGIRGHILASSLSGIIAQRLVRKLCPHCKVPEEFPEQHLTALGVSGRAVGGDAFARAVGCKTCLGTGYLGRVGVFEMLPNDPWLRELIASQPQIELIRKAAEVNGFRTMLVDGVEKAARGITSLEEIRRIIPLEHG